MTTDELFEEIEKSRLKRTEGTKNFRPTPGDKTDAERAFRLDPVFGN